MGVAEGFDPSAIGITYSKDCPIFSEANDILQSMLYVPGQYDYTWSVTYVQDQDATLFPEVYQAWQAAGGDEGLQTIAKVPELGKFAVGFGGKKIAERAAKLALAINIALESDHTASVVRSYPAFGKLLNHLGAEVPGGGGGGGGARASPY